MQAISKKRTVTFILVACIVSTLTVGCGNSDKKASNGSQSATNSQSSNFNKTGLPIVNEPVTLKILTTRWGNMGDSFTKNQWLIDLEKRQMLKLSGRFSL